MKRFLSLAIFAAMSIAGAAEALFDGSNPAAWVNKKPATAKDGAVTVQTSYIPVRSKEFILVPRGKKYTLTGEFRVTSAKPAALYFGVTPYTAKDEEIPFTAIGIFSRNLAALAKDVKVGDKSMILKDAAAWKFHKHARFAMDAKADRSDIPNLNISPIAIINEVTINEDGTVEIPFKKGFTKAYAAGTMVRQHYAGNSYIYAGNTKKNGEWVKISKTFSGFYAGTAKVKVTFSVMSPNAQVELRNVKLIAE